MAIDKVAIVTGGNRGIGLGITKRLVDSGYKVFVGARQKPKLDKVFDNKVFFQYTDVREEEDHIKLIEFAIQKFGSIDCYINNAGYSEWMPIDKIDDEFLSNILNTNLKGAFWGSKAAAKHLKKGGSIINISSLAGKRGSSNNSAYCSSKFGVNGITQSLSKEVGKRNIRVNAVCPVIIPTRGLIEALDNPESPAYEDVNGFIENFKNTQAALPELPTGEQIGNFCLFLASDRATAVTGQCINVDCGVLPQ